MEINHSKTLEALIEVGSKVKFVDGSYTLTIKNKSFKMTHEFEGLRTDVVTVVAVNIPCPTDVSVVSEALNYQNNCIVMTDEGDVIFCSHINIVNVKPLFN